MDRGRPAGLAARRCGDVGLWLAATELGLSVLPFSAVIEVPSTRETLRGLLSFVGYPYLLLRLGIPDPDHACPPHTPRLPAEQVIDIGADG